MEASTLYLRPRNLPIVRALVGDSTITSGFWRGAALTAFLLRGFAVACDGSRTTSGATMPS